MWILIKKIIVCLVSCTTDLILNNVPSFSKALKQHTSYVSEEKKLYSDTLATPPALLSHTDPAAQHSHLLFQKTSCVSEDFQ